MSAITKSLAKDIIRDYEAAIKECYNLPADAVFNFLVDRHMHYGLCHYAVAKYSTKICNCPVLNKHLGDRAYMCPTIHDECTVHENIQFLKTRVNWLKTNMNKFANDIPWRQRLKLLLGLK